MKYLYVIAPARPPLKKLFLWKLGISDDPARRAAEIETSIYEKGQYQMPLKCWLSLPLLSARLIERKGHGFFARFRSKRVPHKSSGYTEWFDWPNIIAALLVYVLFPHIPYLPELLPDGTRGVLFLIAYLAPVPIDFMLFAIVAALAEWVIVFSFAAFVASLAGLDLLHQVTTIGKVIAALIT